MRLLSAMCELQVRREPKLASLAGLF